MQITQSYLDGVRGQAVVNPGEDSAAAAADLCGYNGEEAGAGVRKIAIAADEGDSAQIVPAESSEEEGAMARAAPRAG